MMLSKENVKKVLVGAGLAAVGAALTYLGEYASGSDLGQLKPVVTAGLAVLVNYVRKLVEENKEPVE